MSVDARHRRVGSRLAEEATGRLAPRDGPRLTLSVPVDGFGDVARCVLGGAAGMVDLGFEAIDDVQLALELVLRSGVVLGDSATIAIAGDPTGLVVGVSEVDATVARRLLCAKSGGGMALGDVLSRVVDDVSVTRRPVPELLLRKTLSPQAA